MKMNLTELAHSAHVDESRVEEYVKNGLLGSNHSTVEFDDSDLYWIDMIQCFQENGTSLSDLSGLMPRCRQAQSKMTQLN
ncbi:MerR family transcriptional regulator [Levilactobacillus zymae]|uniref:MerR family transcriptional regulator n=1 Tax=Levilactobacillus zymae TaxID=267363 RepID=UPI0028BB1766|nr:MerR family transcriptional regulator [Levilactobacillus zymae]MDT6981094.1 MerR family transcriptional regulator [Levilactobacillus zymae]